MKPVNAPRKIVSVFRYNASKNARVSPTSHINQSSHTLESISLMKSSQ